MKEAEVFTSIDWIRYSIPWENTDPNYDRMIRKATMPRRGWGPTGERRRGAKGYDLALPLTAGMAHVHTQRRAQKIGIELTGLDIEELRRLGIDDEYLIKHIRGLAGKPSRLDFAIDIKGVPSRPFDLYDAWEKDALRTRMKKVMCFSSSSKEQNGEVSSAETVYFGASRSGQRVRIYDKAKQMGESGHWTRIEACFRKRRANDVMSSMLMYGIAPVGRETIQSIIGCESIAWWTEAIKGESAPVTKTPRKDTKTARWLQEDVLPVFLRVIVEEHKRGEYGTWSTYATALSNIRLELGIEEENKT